MINFVLCDDNISFLNGLEGMLSKLFLKNNIDAEIIYKTDSDSKLINFIKSNPCDVLFLDISLKNKVSGLNVAEEIRKINKNLRIIFTTAHFEYVMEAYKVQTFDYLVKPISQDKLEETVLRLIDYLENSSNNFMKINGTTFINQSDIHYIKREGMKLIYHTKKNDYESYNSFAKIMPNLPINFVRCHKSFIANTSHIFSIDSSKNIISFNDSSTCDIGPKYKSNFMEVINYGNFSNNLDSINYAK